MHFVVSHVSSMRISTPDLNHVKTALTYRSVILKKIIMGEADIVKTSKASKEECPYGVDIRMVRKITKEQKLLTSAEKDELVAKYNTGMSMAAIAAIYGCHYTTVGRILRRKSVDVRK